MFDDLTNVSNKYKSSVEVVGPKKSKGLPFSKGTVLLIDADTHAYRAAAACDGSYWACLDVNGKQINDFKYASDAKKYMAGYDGVDRLEQRWKPEPLSRAIANLKKMMMPFVGRKCELYLTPKLNFRNDVVDNYKANRAGKRRPKHLKACKDYLTREWKAETWEGFEADDAVIVRGEQLTKEGKPWVIVGCDKDLKQIAGTFYDPFKEEKYVISAEEGRKNLWRQIAAGDATDNIITPKGIGPKTFDKFFKGIDFSREPDWTLMLMMMELYKTKEKRKLKGDNVAPNTMRRWDETDKEYNARIALWIKHTARLVYLVRTKDDRWVFPKNDGGIRW